MCAAVGIAPDSQHVGVAAKAKRGIVRHKGIAGGHPWKIEKPMRAVSKSWREARRVCTRRDGGGGMRTTRIRAPCARLCCTPKLRIKAGLWITFCGNGGRPYRPWLDSPLQGVVESARRR